MTTQVAEPRTNGQPTAQSPKTLKEAILMVIVSSDGPMTKPEIVESLRKMGFPFASSSVDSALWAMKQARMLYAVGESPMRYIDAPRAEDLIAHMDDPPSMDVDVKEPLGEIDFVQVDTVAASDTPSVDTPLVDAAIQEPPMHTALYMLVESIEHLIIKFADYQVTPPQITVKVDLGEAEHTYLAAMADLRLEMEAKDRTIAELIQGRNKAEERLILIRAAAGEAAE